MNIGSHPGGLPEVASTAVPPYLGVVTGRGVAIGGGILVEMGAAVAGDAVVAIGVAFGIAVGSKVLQGAAVAGGNGCCMDAVVAVGSGHGSSSDPQPANIARITIPEMRGMVRYMYGLFMKQINDSKWIFPQKLSGRATGC
ncbi:MAG: hypothetical protein BZY82_00190 [SAR202 cluster bacterium Io17-Chloro-G3]|nr:MAG: hypothetical protein BZY82_00190 [SAR202 cluster bacterium Io17-Chloro-G3]